MAVNDGSLVFSGMYGAAYDGATLLYDVIEVSGAVEIGRTDVPLVGTTRMAYKRGRETREGTIRFHKTDSYWELKLADYFSQTLSDRRNARGTAAAKSRAFDLTFRIDDPEAGVEAIKLIGVEVWRMPIGSAISDELIERELPMTWNDEKFIDASVRSIGPNGQYNAAVQIPKYVNGVKAN